MQSLQGAMCWAQGLQEAAGLQKLRENLQDIPKRWLARTEQPQDYLLGHVTGERNYHFTFRLEGGGYFQTGVLVASAERTPGGMPVPLRCRWHRLFRDGYIEIPGVTSNMYQISADDVGTQICVEAEPADSDDGSYGRVRGEIGPFELDPATRRSLDNALGTGSSRFVVAEAKGLGSPDGYSSSGRRQELVISASLDGVRVSPAAEKAEKAERGERDEQQRGGGAERPSNRDAALVEYAADYPRVIIHPLDTTKFQLVLSQKRQYQLVASSRIARDQIALTIRCFHAIRYLPQQVVLQGLLPIQPASAPPGSSGPRLRPSAPAAANDEKLDACIVIERLTKELNRAMHQKETSEKHLRNTNNEKRQLQSQLMETISGFTEVIEGIQDQVDGPSSHASATPVVTLESLRAQVREAVGHNKLLRGDIDAEKQQHAEAKQLREERHFLQLRLREMSSTGAGSRDQVDQAHTKELKRFRQDVEVLHNQKEQLRRQLQDSDKERQELQDNFLYVKGQLDKVQMRQAHEAQFSAGAGAGSGSELRQHRQTLDTATEDRNRLAMRLEGLLREVEKEKAYHEQSLERVCTANARLLEERDRAAREVQRLSQLYADSVQQFQGASGDAGSRDPLAQTGVFRTESVQVDADPAEEARLQAQLAQLDASLTQREQENDALKGRIRKLAVTS